MTIVLERPDSGGWLALFVPLPADKEKRNWKRKLRWARRQLNNLEGIKNDTAASHAAMGQATGSNGGTGRVAGAQTEAAAATHLDDCIYFLQHFCIFLQLMCIFSNPPPFFFGARSLLRTHIRPFGLYKRSYQPAHTSPPAPHRPTRPPCSGVRAARRRYETCM